VYVQRFPEGTKLTISGEGGAQPRWRADGKELFYMSADNRLMAVPVDFTRGARPSIGIPVPLFTANWTPQAVRNYQPSRDGRRFLIDVQ
jgi:hypothetical protein